MTPEQLAAIRDLEARRRTPPTIRVAIGLGIGAWFITLATFAERNIIALVGSALVCAAVAMGTRLHTVRAGVLALVASVPWMIFRNRELALAMEQDLKDRRWTAYALDGSLGSILITLKAFALASATVLAVALVEQYRGVRQRPGRAG